MSYSKRLKICHVASGDLWGGAEAQVALTLKKLNEINNIELVTILLNDGILAEKLVNSGVKTHVIREREINFMGICLKAFKILKRFKPDIIHTHRYKENLIGMLLSKMLLKSCYVRTQHTSFYSLDATKDDTKMRFYRLLDRISGKLWADKIVAVSYDINNQISASVDPRKIITINNFIDAQKVVEAASHKDKGTSHYKGAFVIGTVGRLVEVKGYQYLIEAARLLCNKLPQAKFVIVGSGPLYPELLRQIKRCGLTHSVVLTGFQKDTGKIISGFDIFVLPSLYEGVSIALLEALALGKPIVATNVGGTPDVIKDGINGILIRPRDPEAICDKCLFLYNNKEEREKLSFNAKKSAREEFDPADKVRQLVEMYEELVFGGKNAADD